MKFVTLLMLSLWIPSTPILFAQQARIPKAAFDVWSSPQNDLADQGVWELRITSTRRTEPKVRTYKRFNQEMRLVMEDKSALVNKAGEADFSVGVIVDRSESFRLERSGVDGKWAPSEVEESNSSGMVIGCEWCLRQGTHVNDRIDYARFLNDDDTTITRVWKPVEGVLRIRCTTTLHGGETHTLDFDTQSWRAIKKVIRRKKGIVTTIELSYDKGELAQIEDTLESPFMTEPVTTTFRIKRVPNAVPDRKEYTREFYGVGPDDTLRESN